MHDTEDRPVKLESTPTLGLGLGRQFSTEIRLLRTIDGLDRGVRTYFYGSARLGQRLFKAMGDAGSWTFCGFIDSKKSGRCLDFPIYDLGDFAARYIPGDQVVITSAFVDEIAFRLSELGIPVAYDANPWHNARTDDAHVAVLSGGVPIRNGVPYSGPDAAVLIEAQARCDRTDYDGAAAVLHEAQHPDCSSTALLSMLAQVRWGQNRHAEALELCTRALRLDPKHRAARNRMGRIQFDLRRYDDVCQTARQLLEDDPDDISAVQNYAIALLRSRPVADVIAALAELASVVSPARRKTLDYFTQLANYLGETEAIANDLPDRLRLGSTGRKRFVLSLTAFSDAYVDGLLRFTIPSLLAEGNIERWASVTDSMFLITTNASQVERIASSPAYRALSAHLKCEIVSFADGLVFDESALKYQLFTVTLIHAIRIAKANAAGLSFFAPDYIFSTNFMDMLWKHVDAGKEAIFYCMHTIERRPFQELDEIDTYREDPKLSIGAGDLCRLGLPLISHLASRKEYHDGGVMTDQPTKLNWRLPDGGILTQGYLQHPLMFGENALAAYEVEYFGANDSDFLSFIDSWDPDHQKCVLVPDGDAAVAFEFASTSTEHVRNRSSRPISDNEKIAAYGVGYSPVARWLLTQRAVFRTHPAEQVQAAVEASSAAVSDICERIARIHREYGERRYTTGYVPFINLAFPESPVEV